MDCYYGVGDDAAGAARSGGAHGGRGAHGDRVHSHVARQMSPLITLVPAWVWHSAWHGFRGAVIAFSTGVAVAGMQEAWPTNWQWLIIVAGVLVGFCNGAESGGSEPK